jgi:hypothetical protein
VSDGKLVGIVGRAKLLRALATANSASTMMADSNDRTISDQSLEIRPWRRARSRRTAKRRRYDRDSPFDIGSCD